ncbi:MAG: WD40 repeat domain-containing protein [Treponema sp.]|nr:WD40 repeat domain-containing protein [Treponema sp.]
MIKFSKKAILNISIIFIILQAAFAEELVIPVIKAPYPFENAQWDSSGNYFAYQVNGRVYIRDALTLLLKDSFTADSQSQLSAFYKSPDLIAYPKTSITLRGKSITVQTKRNEKAEVSTFSIPNLPVEVKAAAINRLQSHLAFIGSDGKAYIYDIKGKSVVSSVNCKSQSQNIYFTSDNRVIFSDTDKTAGLYSISGQKIKTYTNANSIKGLSLSPDEETLILFEDTGNLNFYNVNNSTQLGYIPDLGSKEIESVELSQDSRRFLITGKNKCLYVANVKDFLFSPNTNAAATKQFAFNYNKLDPNSKNDDGVTEYGLKEITTVEDEEDAEFIESTREKDLGKQNFELADEKKPAQPVQIASQKEVKTYPSSNIPDDREVTFTEEDENVQELTAKVTEYRLKNEAPSNRGTNNGGNTTIIVTNNDSPASTASGESTGSSVIITSGTGGSFENGTELVTSDVDGKDKTSNKNKNSDKTKDKKSKDKNKQDKKTLAETLKEIHESEDENIILKYKDGQGILLNVGAGLLPSPWLFDVSIPIGYRNYKLLKPFYFGITAEPYLGFSPSTFPYNYSWQGYYLGNPKLLGVRAYIPFGFCMFPLKNKFEVFGEIDLGASFNWIWDGRIGTSFIIGSMFYAFYGEIKVGVAWDMANISLCATYDAILGFSFRVEAGIVINLKKSKLIPASAANKGTGISNLNLNNENTTTLPKNSVVYKKPVERRTCLEIRDILLRPYFFDKQEGFNILVRKKEE